VEAAEALEQGQRALALAGVGWGGVHVHSQLSHPSHCASAGSRLRWRGRRPSHAQKLGVYNTPLASGKRY
jgi:hypothetical protein